MKEFNLSSKKQRVNRSERNWYRQEDVKGFIKLLKENPYAYLCNECCTILECPCFINGKCPTCGSESKIKLIAEFQINKEAGSDLI